jgi:molybdate transport system substrate-binding protein
VNFVRNHLVVVVPGNSNTDVTRLDDLRRAEISRIGLGTPDSVPAGHYARDALKAAGLWDALSSKYVFGQNVRQVLDYVARSEVGAGFVYATDAQLLKDKVKVAFEVPLDKPVLYPVAVVKGTQSADLARAFTAYLTSESGHRILAKYGFSRP